MFEGAVFTLTDRVCEDSSGGCMPAAVHTVLWHVLGWNRGVCVCLDVCIRLASVSLQLSRAELSLCHCVVATRGFVCARRFLAKRTRPASRWAQCCQGQ